MNKMAEIRQRKKEKLLALVGNKAPTMGQVNPNFSTSDIELFFLGFFGYESITEKITRQTYQTHGTFQTIPKKEIENYRNGQG